MRKHPGILTVVFLLCLALPIFCLVLSAEEVSAIKSTSTYQRIKSKIDQIRVVDVHEHLPPEKNRLDPVPDFFDQVLRDYTGADIGNIGNAFSHDQKFRDKSLSIEERWASFLPIYDRIKNTGYMRCLRLGFKKVHGIDIKDADSIRRINESIVRLYKPGIYRKILFDMGKIDYVLTPKTYDHLDRDAYPDFFRIARYIDRILVLEKPEDIETLEKRYHQAVHSLDDMEKIYRKFVDESIEDGVVGFKTALAYVRPIDYELHSRDEAETILRRVLVHIGPPWPRRRTLSLSEGGELTNYCMHLMLKIIEEKGLPISFHTGLQTGGKKDIRFTNPQHLIPLFREYKNVNFDLYHGGFPFVHEFGELGKSWPNVYLDLCWFHTISPEGARSQLSELVELVPIHKIFAFGADTSIPESVIGHLEMAKENCALVLAEKVLNGFFTEEEAVEYARRILRTNPIEVFDLK